MTEPRTDRPCVLLLDDHPAVRQGLALLLQQKDIAYCTEAANRRELMDHLGNGRVPELVLLDLSLEAENGLDLVHDLHQRGIAVLVYSMHDDPAHVAAAFAAGVRGYVAKREMAATLLDAIEQALAGRRFISPVAARALADGVDGQREQRAIEQLSAREQAIFRRMGEGLTSADLAREFGISVSTVETYYTRIVDKLGCSGVKALRRRAIQYVHSMPS